MGRLSEEEMARYDRQMMIAGWGKEAQLGIKRSKVFVAGAGGLGSPVSIYLAVAGVGQISICDADRIELSNLNRQILHPSARIGQSKATSAGQTLRALNPEIEVIAISDYVDHDSVERIVGRPDAVVDCLDNYETRYLLSSYCLERDIPFVHGAIEGLLGQVTFLHPPRTPCLRCLFPEAPPRRPFPALGATPGVIGCIQAMEVLKYLSGVGETLSGRLLIFEGEEMVFTPIRVERTRGCPDCGHL